MIGGENAFGKGNYRGTVIEEILPVVLDKSGEKMDKRFFKLKLENRTHPLADISSEGEDTARAWKELPMVEGCQLLRRKKGSTVIAVHPDLKADGGKVVCIACQDVGKGRSMAIGINTTWRWLLSGARKGEKPACRPDCC